MPLGTMYNYNNLIALGLLHQSFYYFNSFTIISMVVLIVCGNVVNTGNSISSA